MKRTVITIFGTLILFSCSSSQTAIKLTDGGRNVKVLDSKPGSNCEVMGKVEGLNDFGSVEVARVDARNQAAKMNANFIYINEEIMNGNQWKINAMAYECK